MKTLLLINVFITLCVLNINAQNYYVRSGAAGNNDGSDWNNAFDTLPDVLVRGATYYIADGEYPSYTFNDDVSEEEYITIKKAIESDHGTGTGWLNSYGDGQAIFNSSLTISTNYWIINGSYEHGFEIRMPPQTCNSVGIVIDDVNYNQIMYVKVDAAGDDWASVGASIFGNNNLISHCWFANLPNDAIKLQGNNNIIEYSRIGPRTTGVANQCCSGNVCHADAIEAWITNNIVFRYNTMDWGGLGIHLGIGSSSSGIWQIYGNVFSGSNQQGNGIQINSVNVPIGPVYVYNNVFYDYYRAVSHQSNTIMNLSNNIFHYIDRAAMGSGDNITFDYNYFGYFNDTYAMPTDSNRVDGGDPFIDATNRDFYLRSNSSARDNGLSLSSPYDIDAEGNLRGEDGLWDIGAYEYTTGTNIHTALTENKEILQIYPNPFKTETTIEYKLSEQSEIEILLYEINGRLVKTIFSGVESKGSHSIELNSRNLSPGIYFIKLTNNNFAVTKKCLIIK